jgi:tetraacyldisaccharide 4'-kinase
MPIRGRIRYGYTPRGLKCDSTSSRERCLTTGRARYNTPLTVEPVLFGASEFRDIVSGRRRGAGAIALRGVLRVAECFYAAAVRRRNGRYDRGAAAAHRVGVPVVSVGNLTLGGTGKTPLVEWLAGWFLARGVRTAVVSRGYGAAAGEQNDEARELRRLLPDVPHVQNADRVAAAQEAIRAFDAQLVVLDDGFQHRRIARDLDIVLLDALEPFGFGHVFPRGTLREPVGGLRRAGAVVLSRADLLDSAQRADVWRTVRLHAPTAIRAEAVHAPRMLISTDGQQMPLDAIRGQSVAAFCGIGNPAGFRHTLETCRCRVAGFREFPDHHRFTSKDIDLLAEWSHGLGVSAMVCTCKDLVKLQTERIAGRPLWAVRIEMEFTTGRELLESRLKSMSPT